MCFAAGLNVAVTRTPFASPLILVTLSGQPNISAPAICASLASLFITRSSKFIGPQRDRDDLKFVGDVRPLEPPAMPAVAAKDGEPAGAVETGALLGASGVNGTYDAIVGGVKEVAALTV